jgi:nitrate reductase gamma subunit
MFSDIIPYITIAIGLIGLHYARKSANKQEPPRLKDYSPGIKRRR